MKKIRLNPQVLSTMFIGFNRHLFTAPKQGDMYSVDEDNHDCTIYFTEDFWEKYVSELQSAYLQGKFAKSNANSDWTTLLHMIQRASDSVLPSNAADYYNTIKMFL